MEERKSSKRLSTKLDIWTLNIVEAGQRVRKEFQAEKPVYIEAKKY